MTISGWKIENSQLRDEMPRINERVTWWVWMMVLGFGVLWLYGPIVLLSEPCSIHFIRQTDSLAFIAHFRSFGSGILWPGILDLRNAPASGACASEFPIFYWSLAWIERIIGERTYLLRWVNLALVVIGHFAMIRAVSRTKVGQFASVGLLLLVFGSSVVVYYASNYLPDAAAYGLVLIGYSRILPSLYRGTPKSDLIGLVVFALAGLLKAPLGMHLIIWTMLLLLFPAGGGPVVSRAVHVVKELAALMLVASWHIHVLDYNAEHSSRYFLTWVEPIWQISSVERGRVLDLIWNYWWSKYLHPSVWHSLAVVVVLCLFLVRSIPGPVRWLMVLLASFLIGFVLLFFKKLADHDYYFMTLMPLVILLFIICAIAIAERSRTLLFKSIAIPLIWMMAIASMRLAHVELGRRYDKPIDGFDRTALLTTGLSEFARSTPLPIDARVLVVGDSTSNGALLRLGRLGWSYPGYPARAAVRPDSLARLGATHLLHVGRVERPILEGTIVGRGPTWSLWKITQ